MSSRRRALERRARPYFSTVPICACELFASVMACLKLPAPRCGATSSHRERLRDVSMVRYSQRSMEMATPTTKMMTSGYRKNPPSWKNLIKPLMKPTGLSTENEHAQGLERGKQDKIALHKQQKLLITSQCYWRTLPH